MTPRVVQGVDVGRPPQVAGGPLVVPHRAPGPPAGLGPPGVMAPRAPHARLEATDTILLRPPRPPVLLAEVAVVVVHLVDGRLLLLLVRAPPALPGLPGSGLPGGRGLGRVAGPGDPEGLLPELLPGPALPGGGGGGGAGGLPVTQVRGRGRLRLALLLLVNLKQKRVEAGAGAGAGAGSLDLP